jgi:hypothetical protein
LLHGSPLRDGKEGVDFGQVLGELLYWGARDLQRCMQPWLPPGKQQKDHDEE